MDTKSQNSNMLLAFLTLVGVIAVVALVGFFMLHKGPEIVQGQADVNEYRVSSKVPGRILEFRVKEGQAIRSPCWKRQTYRPSWNRHRQPKPLHRHRTKRLSKEHARSRSRAPMKCGRKHVPA